MDITSLDKKKYVLGKKKDVVILEKIKLLEKMKLNNSDKIVLRLIKTQLEREWRRPLIIYLNKLINKYR